MPLFVGCDIELAACVATEEAIRREGTRERVREWRKMARRREQERRREQYHARREERNALRRERDRAARSAHSSTTAGPGSKVGSASCPHRVRRSRCRAAAA